ncbi:MAG TPA: Ppx/GppA family phosphatase [Sorangium sp.]|nr:Ppx/GppA family phosphatase [Sorangium sp.]
MTSSQPPVPTATRVAAIDIGTNSVLLLIAERRDGALVPICERATITRLGQAVDATAALAPAAVARTLACLKEYGALMDAHGVSRRGAVGTSAMRDAAGGGAFVAAAEALIGVAPEVISGEREARLTFEGALTGLPHRGQVAVFDVGGGSTEIIRGSVEAQHIEACVSLNIGAVRLTERHLHHDPPSPDELRVLRDEVRETLAGAPVLAGRPLVGVAGTVTTLAAVVHDVAPYDGARIHGSSLSRKQVAAAIEQLASLTLEARRHIAALPAKRADVIVAGAIIVDEMCAFAAADGLVVSDRGVRWGLARTL